MKFNIITSILVVLSVVLYGEVVLKNNNDKDKKNYEKLSLNEYKKTSTLPIINIKSDSKINFVEVFNLQGKIIYEKYNIDINKIEIDFEKYNQGAYFIRIKTDDGSFVKKIVLNK